MQFGAMVDADDVVDDVIFCFRLVGISALPDLLQLDNNVVDSRSFDPH